MRAEAENRGGRQERGGRWREEKQTENTEVYHCAVEPDGLRWLRRTSCSFTGWVSVHGAETSLTEFLSRLFNMQPMFVWVCGTEMKYQHFARRIMCIWILVTIHTGHVIPTVATAWISWWEQLLLLFKALRSAASQAWTRRAGQFCPSNCLYSSLCSCP